MPTVARFNLTPVKSTALLHPDQLHLSAHGAEADRRFLFLKEGRRVSGESKAELLPIRSSYDPAAERLELAFPDGTSVEGDATGEGAERDVLLFDRTVVARDVGGPFAAAVSAFVGRPLVLARVDAPESAGGAHRVSLISLTSVADLGRRGGADTPPDPRRFRGLVDFDDAEPYEEDGWSGRLLRLGEAVVRVGDGMPRCVITTRDPDTGLKDFPTLDVLATYRRVGTDLLFGVYADVVEPGTVRVGDPIEPLPA